MSDTFLFSPYTRTKNNRLTDVSHIPTPYNNRLVEVTPYPVSALSMVLFFEVGSAWSYLSYLVKSRGPRVLDAVGLREVRVVG